MWDPVNEIAKLVHTNSISLWFTDVNGAYNHSGAYKPQILSGVPHIVLKCGGRKPTYSEGSPLCTMVTISDLVGSAELLCNQAGRVSKLGIHPQCQDVHTLCFKQTRLGIVPLLPNFNQFHGCCGEKGISQSWTCNDESR